MQGTAASTTNDVRPVVSRAARARLFAICCLCVVIDGLDTQSFGFLAPWITRDLGVTLPQFGAALTGGMAGLGLGSLLIGRMADRLGRRTMLTASLLVFGLATAATALAGDWRQLLVLRLIAGVGLGGAAPATMALVTDITPPRLRAFAIPVICACMPIGGLVGSALGAWLVSAWGWKPFLLLGGGLAVAITPIFLLAMPAALDLPLGNGPARLRNSAPPLGDLFTDALGRTTALLWTVFFANLLAIYFFISWLPGLLVAQGFAARTGVVAIGVFSFGGLVGTLAQGPIMARFGTITPIAAELLAVATLAAILAVAPLGPTAMLVVVGVLSFALQAAQAGIVTAAASAYPPALRATGIGWALGAGRIGAVGGPLIGSLALQAGLGPRTIFLIIAAILVAPVFASLSLRRQPAVDLARG